MPFYFRLGKRSQQYNVANKDLFVIPIELLTNECIECTLFSNSIGQECLNNVCQKIGIQQPEYFSLLFKSKKNVDQWVDLNRPLKKQLDKYAVDVRLYFRLQYFVPNFHFLTDEVSRYHYFCAMKGLVIDGRIACSRDDAILLASFSLQAEFGDYSPERHTVEYLNNFALFPKAMIISKIARDVLVECAINAYRNLQGVPSSVAEIYYISEAQRREGYGQEGFPAKDLDTGQDVCLGVCIRGIFAVNTEANTLELFKWMDIANLIHNKKVFTIERNMDKYSKNYSTYDGDYANCIWHTCVEQHQYFTKGIQTVVESEPLSAEQRTGVSVPFIQGAEFFNDNLMHHKMSSLAQSNHTIDYGPDFQKVHSLYETINKSSSMPISHNLMPHAVSNMELSNMPHEYQINGCLDKKIEHSILRQRSSTEPIDLHHITINCNSGNANSYVNRKAPELTNETSTLGGGSTQTIIASNSTVAQTGPSKPSSNSPLQDSSIVNNAPIYENQPLNLNDLTLEQKKKLLPPYKSPPDYETFLRHKYSAVANTLSQSLSNIPSRVTSHNQINSSSFSLAQGNGGHGMAVPVGQSIVSPLTMSVPHLLQHQQQQHQRTPLFSGSIYKNYADLSNLDIDKSYGANGLVNITHNRSSLPTTDVVNGVPVLESIGSNQLRLQKQQMQTSGMITSSSPELNTLNLFQKRNAHLYQNIKTNGMPRVPEHCESTLKNKKQVPYYFTSAPDLTFKNCVQQLPFEMASNEHKKFSNTKSKSFFSFGGKNLKFFWSQNKTGSEPNLFNDASTSSNCYNLKQCKLSVEQLHVPQSRSNSVSVPESHSRQSVSFGYSITHKIDEVPEVTGGPENEQHPVNGALRHSQNVYSPAHQQKQLQHQPQVIYVNFNSPQSVPNSTSEHFVPKLTLHQVNITKRADISVKTNGDNFTGHPIVDANPQAQIIADNRLSDTRQSASLNPIHSFTNSRIIVFDKCFEDQDFTREFELLPRMNPTAKFTTASLADNILKNRFRDILPYEENRVKLSPSKENKLGYINASHVYMTFGSMKQHYIAAQGPLPNTTLDFWQMVYEQNVSLIVMVTNFTESGIQKCYNYLPLSNEPGKNILRFGDFEITCNFTSISLTYVSSFLTLSYNGQRRSITHLRYTDWNDHSIPGDLQGFLTFLSEMDAIYRRNSREGSGFGKKRVSSQMLPPIVVHCSAGAGRSGVLILCDALLKCLDHNFSEPIDISRALIQLRFQRMISVQHCEQFRFVCQVISQYLTNSRLI